MRGWVLAPIHALINLESIVARNFRSGPRYLFYESLWLRYLAEPQALELKYRGPERTFRAAIPGMNVLGGRHQRHPPRRFDLGVRLCSVPTEQRRTPHDGRKDPRSFLPSCREWPEPSRAILHDGRKDLGSFLPSLEAQEGREDARSSLPSCEVNSIIQCVDGCSHPSTH